MRANFGYLLGLLLLCGGFAQAQEAEEFTPATGNREQMLEVGEEPALNTVAYEAPQAAPGKAAAVATVAQPVVRTDDFMVLGYPQDLRPADSYMWHGLTHMMTTFMDFDDTGTIDNKSNWTSRNAHLARGGTADKYGVKVLMCVRNKGFVLSNITTVMASPTLRAKLVSEIVTLVNASDSNAAGVNFDLEPEGYGSVAAGVTSFFQELRTQLPGKELSLYVSPSYPSAYTGHLVNWMAQLDYMLYSCYPWSGSWSTTLSAVVPLSSYKGQVDKYILNGCPPEKMVLTLAMYGGEATTLTGSPGATKATPSNLTSLGFSKGKFNTTLSANKKTRQYQSGQEIMWYVTPNGTQFDMGIVDDEFSNGVKTRGAVSWQGAQSPGRRLRGIGYWSLMWSTDNYWNAFQSRDMEAGTNGTNIAASSNRTRTYPHIYQMHNETLAPPGTRTFPIDKWEHVEGRWRALYNGADSIGCSAATFAVATTPNATNKPAESANCALASVTFTATANNRCFLRHEILGHYSENTIADRNAAKALFDRNTRLNVDVYTAAAYSGRTIRFMMMDANGELEMSPAQSLNASGWRTLTFDLTRTSVSAFTTTMKSFKSGNGVLNTAGGGARDLACVGFLVEGGGTAGAVSVYLDELRYTKVIPPGREYVINELRYSPATGQFIEIYGPAGAFPLGMELRLIQSSNGTAYNTIDIGGKVVPNDRNGYGYFVVGSAATPNVDHVIANSLIQSAASSAVQLYDTTYAVVCDALVYQAHSGLFGLDGEGDPRVTQNGYPWVGGLGTGIGGNGVVYSVGRSGDGVNTWVNYADFSSMIGTPGATNDTAVALPVTYNFETVPATGVQTFQTMAVATPPAAVGNSPSGGKVYRCVDASAGGGIQAFIGGPSLGKTTNGYTVTGEVYIPKSTDPAQATAIGICAGRGSAFFSATPATSQYEDGYLLIFENANGATLADDRPDHPGVFEFVQAHNNNMYPKATTLLASKTLANVGLTATGGWTTFKFEINPANNTLTAILNNATVYSGAIPAKGPAHGAFTAAFRENHVGNPATNEGTWVDNVKIIPNLGDVLINIIRPTTGTPQWRIDGGAWYNSGTTVTGVPTGARTISFSAVSGYDTPANISFAVLGAELVSRNVDYGPPSGVEWENVVSE